MFVVFVSCHLFQPHEALPETVPIKVPVSITVGQRNNMKRSIVSSADMSVAVKHAHHYLDSRVVNDRVVKSTILNQVDFESL